MKDKLIGADERKVIDFLMKAAPGLPWRVRQDPDTETCKAFVGNAFVWQMNADTLDELDDPANIPGLVFELEQQLRLYSLA